MIYLRVVFNIPVFHTPLHITQLSVGSTNPTFKMEHKSINIFHFSTIPIQATNFQWTALTVFWDVSAQVSASTTRSPHNKMITQTNMNNIVFPPCGSPILISYHISNRFKILSSYRKGARDIVLLKVTWSERLVAKLGLTSRFPNSQSSVPYMVLPCFSQSATSYRHYHYTHKCCRFSLFPKLKKEKVM